MRLGFVRSARAVWETLPPKVRAKLKEKLRAIAIDPRSAKPLTGPLVGCRRVTYGRIRCICRVIDGQAVVIVLAIGQRKHGDTEDPYILAVRAVQSGGSEVTNLLIQLAVESAHERRDKTT